MATYNILIMGASYGSLLASKLLFGGHTVKLVCLPAEAESHQWRRVSGAAADTRAKDAGRTRLCESSPAR